MNNENQPQVDDFVVYVKEAFAFLADCDEEDLEFEFRENEFVVFGETLTRLRLLDHFRFNTRAEILVLDKEGEPSPAFRLQTEHRMGNGMPELMGKLDALTSPLRLDDITYHHWWQEDSKNSYSMVTGPDGSDYLVFKNEDQLNSFCFGGEIMLVTVSPIEGKNAIAFEDEKGITHILEKVEEKI